MPNTTRDNIWKALKLGQDQAIVPEFKPVDLQEDHCEGAYYFYNESLDRLVVFYAPSALTGSWDFPPWLKDSNNATDQRIIALRQKYARDTSEVTELALDYTFLRGFQGAKRSNPDNPQVTKLYVAYSPKATQPETDEGRASGSGCYPRHERNSETYILNKDEESDLALCVEKLQLLSAHPYFSYRLDAQVMDNIEALKDAISILLDYANKFIGVNSPLANLARDLYQEKDTLFNRIAITPQEYQAFKAKVTEAIHRQDPIINTKAKQIIANILITLTVIGALLLLINLAHSKYKTGTCSFFFSQQRQTHEKLEAVAAAVAKF